MQNVKIRLILISFVLLAGMLLSCDDKDFDPQNPSVPEFVNLLKSGAYADQAGNEMPEFSMNDIGELIHYLNDTTVIQDFPANPISSKVTHPKILSECILWTIEGIRLNKKYASLEPCLINTARDYSRLTNKELVALANHYINWYDAYQQNPSDALRRKNILENMTYQWN